MSFNSNKEEISSLHNTESFEHTVDEKALDNKSTSDFSFNVENLPEPTPEEARTLRRVMGAVPWYCYIICLIEFAERGSYYGTGDRLSNFIQQPLPPNSPHGTGAAAHGDTTSPSGALNQGLQISSALTLLLTFFSYVTPLIGGYLSDKKWGRFKTLWHGVWVGCLSHVIFIIAAIPSVIKNEKGALACTIIGILTISWGSGFIKPSLLPLLMDQYPYKTDVVQTLPSGERVILDRDASLQRVTNIFYAAVNIGSFLSLGTSYAARNIGFWLAFLIPMICYMLMFPILWFLDGHLKKDIPSGESVLEDALKVLKVTFESGWISRWRNGTLWDYSKPSNLIAQGRTSWKKGSEGFGFTDQFVEDVRVTLDACKIFFFYIIYNINDGGLGSLQNSQAASLTANGVPNDLINNFNPITIIVLMPILDCAVYPLLRKMRINFRPVYRIFFGFILAAVSSLAGAIIQWRIYALSPCGNQATNCAEPAALSLWVEVSLYISAAASECFAMTTAYQIAYTRSPEHMKGFVMSLFLFTSAISAAISEAATGAMVDPKLPGIFLGLFIAGAVFAFWFLWSFRNLHVVMERERIEKEAKFREEFGFAPEDNINTMISHHEKVVGQLSPIHSVTSALVASHPHK